MKSIFLILSIVLISCSTKTKNTAQLDDKIIIPSQLSTDNYDEIGFACGEGGGSTSIVQEFYTTIKDKNFSKLKADLFSPKTGRYFLATISCELLNQEREIDLNKKDLLQINKNKTKNDSIYTCSGCTQFDVFSVNKILTDTTNYINVVTHYWINGILGKNIVRE